MVESSSYNYYNNNTHNSTGGTSTSTSTVVSVPSDGGGVGPRPPQPDSHPSTTNSTTTVQQQCNYSNNYCRGDHRLVGGLIVSTVLLFVLLVWALISRKRERTAEMAAARSRSSHNAAPNHPRRPSTRSSNHNNRTAPLPTVDRWMSRMTLTQRSLLVLELLPTMKFKEAAPGGASPEKDAPEPMRRRSSSSASMVELSSVPPLESRSSSPTNTTIAIPHGHEETDEENDNDEPMVAPPGSGTRAAAGATTSSLSSSSTMRECAVCLEAFCQDDEICTSNNPDCPHVFHRRCIHAWLLRQEECPCCRRPYLQFDPLQEIQI